MPEFVESAESGRAVIGKATGEKGVGVYGDGKAVGVRGDGETWHGVVGFSKADKYGCGVYGKNLSGGTGVCGDSDDGTGVVGTSKGGMAVFGKSEDHEGVHAETKSTSRSAMVAYQMNSESNTAAFVAKHAGNRTAARFEGNVEVTGDITLPNADFAEDFDVPDAILVEPGTVMVLGEDGSVQESQRAYDKRVAGVVSGAGEYRPGIVLDKQHTQPNRKPIALLGKVYCKVDAQYGAIEVGDLLTTSPTSGHAMRVDDPLKAFGAVIGKALRPLKEGQELIPILIALQ